MEQVLLVGDNKTIYGLAVCLQKAGHPVLLKTQNKSMAEAYIAGCHKDILKWDFQDLGDSGLQMVSDWDFETEARLAFAITPEDQQLKREVIDRLERLLAPDAVIAVNTESIPLRELQKEGRNPQRIVGMNWVDPIYNTRFLEIIANDVTDASIVLMLQNMAASHWEKDPYVAKGELGIRTPLIAALIREAFYLVNNGYATIEDIDRACRNDAGYYLPFAGNLRYMDLMGTYAYGMVMKDLNQELASDVVLPESFLALVRRGETGMASGKGLYAYKDGEGEKWEQLLRHFSFEIKELIGKYPFDPADGAAEEYRRNQKETIER